MKIAIVDDDLKMFERMQAYLKEALGGSAELAYFASGEAFLQAWQPRAYDLVILDIFMAHLTGVEVAKEIRKTDADVKLVFSTTSNEFASESYEVNACYYLLKPFGLDKVKAMLDRLDLSEIEKNRAVTLPDGTGVVLRNIIYTDCAAHLITLHCKRNRNIVLRSSFSEMEALLCEYPYFFSPTKGMLINFYEVSARDGATFKMSDGSLIPISRRRAGEVLEAYSSFCFAQLRKEDT